ncbi:MAG: hypothetical protein AB1649_02010, partial [Chloroflexota bacterium]
HPAQGARTGTCRRLGVDMAHWFFDTPSIGSIIVFVVAISVFIAYFRMLRWIQTAPPDPKPENETLQADVEK